MASNFYRQKDKPRYILGHALEIGFIGAGLVAALTLVISYRKINSSRDRKMATGAAGNYSAEELSSQGDKAITFRYMN